MIKLRNIKISLCLLLISATSVLGQTNYSILNSIVCSLPDSVYSKSKIEKADITKSWNKFDTINIDLTDYKPYKFSELSAVRDYNFSIEEDKYLHIGIDTTHLLYKIQNMVNQLQVKIFVQQKDTFVVASGNYPFEFACPINAFIAFYKYSSGNYKCITDNALSSFDYAKDNFSKSTIDTLVAKYDRYPHIPNSFVYSLLPSDTIVVFKDFYDFSCCEERLFFLDESHLHNDMFWRKYVFTKGKLKAVGKVVKQ